MAIMCIAAETGDVTVVRDIPGDPGLEWLQKKVGGYIEIVQVLGGDQMIVNEDGRSRGLKPNTGASIMAGQSIVGDAVILSGQNLCQ